MPLNVNFEYHIVTTIVTVIAYQGIYASHIRRKRVIMRNPHAKMLATRVPFRRRIYSMVILINLGTSMCHCYVPGYIGSYS